MASLSAFLRIPNLLVVSKPECIQGRRFIKEGKTYYSKTKRLIQQVMDLTKYTSKKGE